MASDKNKAPLPGPLRREPDDALRLSSNALIQKMFLNQPGAQRTALCTKLPGLATLGCARADVAGIRMRASRVQMAPRRDWNADHSATPAAVDKRRIARIRA
ncbi:hypothetical protein NG825_12465 [Xanthomonas sacchari]|nr:hypothetical protein NG825_12465 [Xanthomonas sacchari]